MSIDLNDADTQNELIPDNTNAHVRIEVVVGDGKSTPRPDGLIKASKSESLMLMLEATVTEGKYAKRKFWPRYFMGLQSGAMTDGQETGVGISRKMVRAIVEAHKGISPTDETPAAVNARRLKSYADIDGMEFWCVVGIEKGKDGFDDKNTLKRILSKPPADDYGQKEAAATRKTVQSATQAKW